MSGFGPGGPFLADCPARLTVELLADKWTAVVLYGLSRGPVRHGELIELIGGISRKMLTQTLRRLEAHGLVSRHAYAEVPPRVEYELTPLGASLIDPIHTLTEWARENADAVLDALDTTPEPNGHGD
ncbi:helix-turn-helix domain-containing protein [Streptomyces griseoviridis]|uniref:Transcriptional regulator n=2 Tax=Streptomyces TaxID=1883 RepID=A0A3S9ZNH4_STRGD|nr:MULTISPECIES: helix-turn-helix domain-containing protein [Streptomyces]AZS89113.1 transcriptional regulator [Streptomyces griseoviridis]MDH6697800.1 DNA-binding HxlR family transcriptional regulator [Streptomyces sp. MAA16]MDT0472461.1 helix-turn-helix domain-containing protein [Streptomyces sp. DSM 41014]QCN84037.1 transcriptional regulator [Streptomyces griseoviridis]